MPKYFLATKHYPRRAPPFPKKNRRPKFEFKHEEAKYRVDLKRDLRVRRIPFNKEAKTEILEKTHERVVGETYPRVTVMGGLFSNLLTSPRAILLDNDQARKISSVVDMNGGPKEIVRVMYLTGRDAGKIEKVRLGSLNADMYEKTPMTLKEAKDVAAKNLKRVKLARVCEFPCSYSRSSGRHCREDEERSSCLSRWAASDEPRSFQRQRSSNHGQNARGKTDLAKSGERGGPQRWLQRRAGNFPVGADYRG